MSSVALCKITVGEHSSIKSGCILFLFTYTGTSTEHVTLSRCYWIKSLSSLTAQACMKEKLGQWLNTDGVMLGLGGVEMITWQTHQAMEKLAMVQEPAILSFFCFWKIPEAARPQPLTVNSSFPWKQKKWRAKYSLWGNLGVETYYSLSFANCASA